METIRNYLENMFHGLPATPEVLRMKAELLDSMEEKYHELKDSGKSEHEAVGTVIAEFGSIDELMSELGMELSPVDEDAPPTLDREWVTEYLHHTRRGSIWVGGGVALILLGVSVFLLMNHFIGAGVLFAGMRGDAETLALIPLFVLLVPAVALFVLFGLRDEQYAFLENGSFLLSPSGKAMVEEEYRGASPRCNIGIAVGICLCVCSALPLFIGAAFGENAQAYGLSMLLLMVATGVFLLIRGGMIGDAYKKLLHLEDYRLHHRSRRESDKVIGAVAAVVWPITAALFLYLGFMHDLWHICWIVFPIVGLLFGAFAALWSILHDRK